MRNIEVKTIRNNFHEAVDVITGLEIGDIVIAKHTKTGTSDGGTTTMLFHNVDLIVKDAEYRVKGFSYWDGVKVPTIIDEDGCTTWVKANLFEVKNENN